MLIGWTRSSGVILERATGCFKRVLREDRSTVWEWVDCFRSELWVCIQWEVWGRFVFGEQLELNEFREHV